MGCLGSNRSLCTDLEARRKKGLPTGHKGLSLKLRLATMMLLKQLAGERIWCFELFVFQSIGKQELYVKAPSLNPELIAVIMQLSL